MKTHAVVSESLEQRALLTTFTVNSLLDTGDASPGDGVADDGSGNVTLRAAIEEANAFGGADTIEFNDGSLPGVNFHDGTPATITLSGTQLEISSDVVITGPGARLLTVSGDDASRVFDVTDGDVSFSGLTIADGQTTRDSGNDNAMGAGMRIAAGSSVRLVNSVVRNNEAAGTVGDSGEGLSGGGIWNAGHLTVIGSLFNTNQARLEGGGIFNRGSGNLTITNTTIVNGIAKSGGQAGGGIMNRGTASVVNTTIAGNRASLGNGGGVFNGGSLSLANSIVAGNLSQNFGPENLHTASGGTTAASHSLIGDAGNSGLIDGADGNIIDVDWTAVLENDGTAPLLAVNGGPRRTVALQPGSPALDAGDDSLAVDANGAPLQTDQRGNGYTRFAGTVDMGAFEAQEAPSLIVTTALDVVDAADKLTSLREALTFANSDPDFSEIAFGDGSALTGGTNFEDSVPDVITLGGTQLEISSDITITGPGADLLTVSGDDASRVLYITDGVVILSGLSVTNGRVSTAADGQGAGIRISNSANVSISDSSISDNEVAGSATSAAGRQGAGIWNNGILNVANSQLSGNVSRGPGGAIHNFNAGTASIVNSTITGNVVRQLSHGGGIWNSGTMAVVSSTISDNFSAVGAGIRNTGTLTLHNSIVAGNVARDNGPVKDIGGNVTGSNNLIGDATSAGGLEDGVDGNIVGVDWTTVFENDGSNPILADNGGPTLTIALLPNGPAINSGSNAEAADLATDQRGLGFDRIVGTVDIGAFEASAATVVVPVDDVNVDEDAADEIIDLSATFIDSSAVTLSVSSDDPTLVSASLSGTDLTLDFGDDQNGSTTITVTAADGAIVTEMTFCVSVNAVNDAPTVVNPMTDVTVEEDAADQTIDLSSVFADIDDTTLTFEATTTDGTVVATSVVDGILTLNFISDGTASVSVTASDAAGAFVTDEFTIVVNAVNNGPDPGVTVDDGKLTIVGTDDDDSIIVKKYFGKYYVYTNIEGFEFTKICASQVDEICVDTGEGDDSIVMRLFVFAPTTLNGGAGDDYIVGGFGDDTIIGGDGDDNIDGGWGDDIVYAGAGNDRVYGGWGHDILLGQSGNDGLYGEFGEDIVIAGQGADLLYGQSRQDILITGETNIDDDEEALKSMRDIWTGRGSVQRRAEEILDSGLEVFHDDDVDRARGGSSLDWLLFDHDLDYAR